jgi:hypothetical protein
MGFVVQQFDTPTGNVPPALQENGDFSASFNVNAQFFATDNDVCWTVEFRQYIKGSFIARGTRLQTPLCIRDSIYLSASDFQEDGCIPPGPYGSSDHAAYGHRINGQMFAEGYYDSPNDDPSQEDPAHGCVYKMVDSPGLPASIVTPPFDYRIDLAFNGQLVDTASGLVLQSQNWTVQGSIANQSVTSPQSAIGIQADDVIKAMFATRNLETSTPEVQLLIARRRGKALLDPQSLRVELKDAEGRMLEASEPRVYETFGRCSNTTFIVYSLANESRAPVKAEIMAGGSISSLVVHNELN